MDDGMRVGRPDARASRPGRETSRRTIEEDGEETMGNLSVEDRSKASESLRALAGGEQVPTWPTLAEAVMGTRQCMRREVVGRLADLAAVTVTEEDHEKQREIIRDLERKRDEALREARHRERTRLSIMQVLAVVTEMEHRVRGSEGADDSPVARWAAMLREAVKCSPEIKEDVEAAKWVREYGGVDELAEAIANDGKIILTVINELWPDGAPSEGAGNDEIAAELDRRLMPPGYEWPRFDDGGMVEIGGHAEEHGDVIEITHVTVSRTGVVLQGVVQGDEDFQARYLYRPGERVKRPKPATVGDDGLSIEKDETVYLVDGDGTPLTVVETPIEGCYQAVVVRLPNGSTTAFDPPRLTHTKPEPPDSAERIADDIRKMAEEWCSHPSLREASEKAASSVGEATMGVALGNLSKRCRALAEREAS